MMHFGGHRHGGHEPHRFWHGMGRGEFGRDGFERGGFGRDGFGRGFGRDGGGRGRRRMFDSGELRLVLLLLMEAEPRHGYDLIREIETRTGGAYAPSPGIVYPTLTMLEELGQIATASQDGPRKLFAITETGRAHLDENRNEAQAALARLEALAAGEGERGDAGPVWRAMHNLKAALAMRLRGSNDKDTLFAISDIIDEAARKIERLP